MGTKLYYFLPSPFARNAYAIAKHLDLDCELVEVNLMAREQYSDWFLKVNPLHTVPVLVDDDLVLTESRAIMKYLVQTRDPDSHLYPADLKQQAIIDQFLYYDTSTLAGRMLAIFVPILFAGETKVADDKRKALYGAFEYLDGVLENRKWIATEDDYSLADIAILNTTLSAVEAGANVTDYSNLQRWLEQCKDIGVYEHCLLGAQYFGGRVKDLIDDVI